MSRAGTTWYSLLLLFTLLSNTDAFANPVISRNSVSNEIKYSVGWGTPSSSDAKRGSIYGVEDENTQSLRTCNFVHSGRRKKNTFLKDQKDKNNGKERNRSSFDPLSLSTELFPDADFVNVREDATLAACYGLCRFLIYDVTTGSKDIPGWELNDFIMLGGAFSSSIVLSALWALIGLYMGIFNDRDSDTFDVLKIPLTAIFVGPLWLITEILFGWPPGGAILVDNLNTIGADPIISVVYTIFTGSIGLASIMWISNGWR